MTASEEWTGDTLARRCAGDGEFRIASRFWTGGLRLDFGSHIAAITVTDGAVRAADPGAGAPGVITLSAAGEAWTQLLAAKPPRFYNDIGNVLALGEMQLAADPVLYAQYYPAVMRAIELLRPPLAGAALPASVPAGSFDSPVGRYVHLDIGGQDHRLYFEEAGSGIPLLLQH